MTNDIIITVDEQGYAIGICGRAAKKAEFREQMRRLRELGAL
jgi:hypothetical protein